MFRQRWLATKVVPSCMRSVIALCLIVALLDSPQLSYPQTTPADNSTIALPFVKYTLDNGLTVILHEDHKAPIVSVYVAYKVGSAEESAGKTGLAHLFEHLMFRGSEHAPGDYEQTLSSFGTTNVGGTTHQDYTRFFETVPNNALDAVLWMESDRMGFLTARLDEKVLQEQKDVVRNEILENEGAPFGQVTGAMLRYGYPGGHPYSWPVVGRVDELPGVSLADVKSFFRKWYVPNNAVLVLAGDFNTDSAKEKIARCFGAIPPGNTLVKPTQWIGELTGPVHVQQEEAGAQSRVTFAWNVPGIGDSDYNVLRVVAGLLGDGDGSRLASKLVSGNGAASSVSAWLDGRGMGSQFVIRVTPRRPNTAKQIEQAVFAELGALALQGPTSVELTTARQEFVAVLVRRLERVGGIGGQADELGSNEVFNGQPDAQVATAAQLEHLTSDQVKAVIKRWLGQNVLIIETVGRGKLTARKDDVDRSHPPSVSAVTEAALPELERATLSNGLSIILAKRPNATMMNFTLTVKGGTAADTPQTAGRATLAMAMLANATNTQTHESLTANLRNLSALLSARAELDGCTVTLSVPRATAMPAMELLTDVLLHPRFAEPDLSALREQQLARIAQQPPATLWRRFVPPGIFGNDHPYAQPVLGTPPSLNALHAADVQNYYDTWFRPNNATLIVVGDITMDELKRSLATLSRDWTPRDVPVLTIPPAQTSGPSLVFLIDRPGATQSDVTLAQLTSRGREFDVALEVLVEAYGASAESRLSHNLRTEKGWAYSPGAGLLATRGDRVLISRAVVQADKTAESMREMLRELNDLSGTRPLSDEEITRARNHLTRSMAGRWETSDAVAAAIMQIVRLGLPDDFYHSREEKLRDITSSDFTATIRGLLNTDRRIWVVVGDRATIEPKIRDLNLGELRIVPAR